jgi:hypothetical protein
MAIRAGLAQFHSGGMRIAVRRVHRFRRVTDQTNTRWLLVWHPEGSGHRRCRLAASSRNGNRWDGRTRPGRRHDHCPPTSRPKCQTTTTTESQSTPMSNSLHDQASPTTRPRRNPVSRHTLVSPIRRRLAVVSRHLGRRDCVGLHLQSASSELPRGLEESRSLVVPHVDSGQDARTRSRELRPVTTRATSPAGKPSPSTADV